MRDYEGAVSSKGVVGDVLRRLVCNCVEGIGDGLPACELRNLCGDGLRRQGAVKDMSRPDRLEVFCVLQGRRRDDRREPLKLR